MRIISIFISLCVIVCLSSCEQKVDIGTEEAAIIEVNKKQMAAFITHDYQGEAEVWSQEPYVVHYHSEAPDIGWETIASKYKTTFDPASGPSVFYHDMTASNYDIRLNGNVAFVFYDQHQEYTEHGERKTDDHRELKYFEKKDGEWKVVVVIPVN